MDMDSNLLIARRRLFQATTVFLVILSLMGVAGFFLIIQFGNLAGNQTAQANTITVQGKGEIYAVPDIAEVSFSIVEEAKTAKEAQEKATAKMNKAKTFLKEQKVADKDINTTNYSVYPKYEYQRTPIISPAIYPCYGGYCPPPYDDGKQVIIGYEVNQSVSVKVRKTDKVGDVLAGLGGLGVSNLYGPNFSFEDDSKVKEEARTKAIEQARGQAKRMAKELGVRLGKIISFQESGNNYPYPMMYGAEKSISVDGGYGGEGDPIISPDVPVGENKITTYVTIVYEIK